MSQTTTPNTSLSPGWIMLALVLLAMAPVSFILELHLSVTSALAPEVTLARPWLINVFWALPGIAILLRQWRKHYHRRIYQLVSPRLLSSLTPSISPERRRLKGVLLFFAWFFLLLALAGPQWGTHVRILKRKGIDVIVAIDVSESMLAKDMPTADPRKRQRRLHLARKKVRYLMQLLAGERIGILAFSGQPVMLCPLSTDYNTCAVWLDSFDPKLIPYGGTAIASTIRRAIPMFATSGQNSRALLLITDGDDHQKDTLKAAKEAKKKGIRIYTLGIGSEKLVTIPPSQLPPPAPNQAPDNRPVQTRLNKQLLTKISTQTQGLYRQAEVTHRDIRALFQHAKTQLQARTNQSRRQVFREERFPLFAGFGFLLLLFEFAFRERRQNT